MTVFVALLFLLLGFAVGTITANEWQAGEREQLQQTIRALRRELCEARLVASTPWSDEYLDELWPGSQP